jgi:hypothetical protein
LPVDEQVAGLQRTDVGQLCRPARIGLVFLPNSHPGSHNEIGREFHECYLSFGADSARRRLDRGEVQVIDLDLTATNGFFNGNGRSKVERFQIRRVGLVRGTRARAMTAEQVNSLSWM